MKTIQILELFGGIGSPRCALRNLGIPVTIFESIFRKIILGQTEKTVDNQLNLFDLLDGDN